MAGTNNPRALFHTISQLCPPIQTETSALPTDLSFCNKVASFFSTKIQTIRANIDSCPPSPEVPEAQLLLSFWKSETVSLSQASSNSLPSPTTSPVCSAPSLESFCPVTSSQVLSILSRLSPASSALDPFPTKIIKSLSDLLVDDITLLVNSSLHTGTVPSAWKMGVVTPLQKKPDGESSDLKNLRPVTQLRLLPRITESIVTSQFQDYLEKHNILHDSQSGFRRGRGTELATAEVREHLLRCADRNHPSLLILLDLSAAFDTIDHDILLERLNKLAGVHGTALQWFKSFLQGRSQQVKIGSCWSDSSGVPFGVPQGSSLSPALFNIYMLPLAKLLDNTGLRFHLYADDTQILVDLHESTGESSRLIPCLSLLRDWMRLNKLCLNESKTEVLLIDGKRGAEPAAFPWPVSWGSPPTPVSTSRNLGVFFNHSLDGKAQAIFSVRSCNHKLNALAKIFPSLELHQRISTVQALVNSRISYGLLLLAGAPKSQIAKLQHVQNRAIRLIFNLPWRTHISPWRILLRWLPIEAQILLKIGLLIWKAKMKVGPRFLHYWVSTKHHRFSQRSTFAHQLVLPRIKKCTRGGRTLAYFGTKFWNGLPLHLRSIDNFLVFKRALKLYLLKTEEDRYADLQCRTITNKTVIHNSLGSESAFSFPLTPVNLPPLVSSVASQGAVSCCDLARNEVCLMDLLDCRGKSTPQVLTSPSMECLNPTLCPRGAEVQSPTSTSFPSAALECSLVSTTIPLSVDTSSPTSKARIINSPASTSNHRYKDSAVPHVHKKVWGVTSPPLPKRNNQFLINLAAANKRRRYPGPSSHLV